MFAPSGDGGPLTAKQGGSGLGGLDAVFEIPDGTCDLETLFDDLLATTFDGAGTDLVPFSPEFRIAHALTIVGEVSERLSGWLAGLWVAGETLKGINDGLKFTVPQIRTDFLDPGLGLGFIRESCLGDRSDVLGSVKPVNNLDGLWIVVAD